MAKKLTLEVDAETSKAKRKIQELAETGGAGGGGDITSDRAANAMSRLAKSTKDFADESERSSATMGKLAKSFAGIAAGMALNYAANSMEPGKGRTSLSYLGSILQGASTGASFGQLTGNPWAVAGGIVIGGGVGAAKTYRDNSKREKDFFTDFRKAEEKLEETRGWAQKFDELTSVQTHFKGLSGVKELKAQLKEVEDASTRTAEAIKVLKFDEKERLNSLKLLEKQEGLTADQRLAEGDKQLEELAVTRQKLAQLESAAKRFGSMKEALEDTIEESSVRSAGRVSMDALDALSRIGGNFGGGGDVSRDQLNVQREMASTLKSIDSKAGGSKTWQ